MKTIRQLIIIPYAKLLFLRMLLYHIKLICCDKKKYKRVMMIMLLPKLYLDFIILQSVWKLFFDLF